jgi:hypothetical protein
MPSCTNWRGPCRALRADSRTVSFIEVWTSTGAIMRSCVVWADSSRPALFDRFHRCTGEAFRTGSARARPLRQGRSLWWSPCGPSSRGGPEGWREGRVLVAAGRNALHEWASHLGSRRPVVRRQPDGRARCRTTRFRFLPVPSCSAPRRGELAGGRDEGWAGVARCCRVRREPPGRRRRLDRLPRVTSGDSFGSGCGTNAKCSHAPRRGSVSLTGTCNIEMRCADQRFCVDTRRVTQVPVD